jgi:hypothetical protein
MAKLIITRPRRLVNRLRRYRILIDGQVAATIADRNKTELALAPGLHQITARLDILRTQPVEIEVGPEGVHHLRVGSNMDRKGPLRFALFYLVLAPVLAPLAVPSGGCLFSDPSEASWFSVFMAPMTVLPSLLLLALLVSWRGRILFVEEISTSDQAVPPEAPRWGQLLRIRITLRGLMVAVAVLAILFGAGVEWMRFTKRRYYQSKASLHSKYEANYRNLQRTQERSAAEFEKAHHCESPIRQSISQAAAMVDYHAAMRRKYEEAAARRAFTVEPDPPSPPWP